MPPQASRDASHGAAGPPFALSRSDDEIGAQTLFPVRQLRRADRREACRRHAGTGENARALYPCRRADRDDRVNPAPAAAFEQERDVEYDDRLPPAAGRPQERRLRLGHKRVNDGFELREFGKPAEHRLPERGPVEPRRVRDAGKRRLDRGERAAARPLQPVHFRIGVENGNAEIREHGRYGRFSHTDRSGEADDLHAVSRSRRASSSSVSTASVSKNRPNASAAWPISMGSPPMTVRPRARAAFMSGVSRGA